MRARSAADDDRREELLRPCRHLGYDRDALASFLMSRSAYRSAESLYRRAVWVNPYEPRFRAHLALCLLKQRRLDEAREIANQLADCSQDGEIWDIVAMAIAGL
jgi:tetratricopeptide (TPR) repeat protein